MKKSKLLLPLLMAMIMMAMSPMKMVGGTSYHYDAGYQSTSTSYDWGKTIFTIKGLRIYNYEGNNSHWASDATVKIGSTKLFSFSNLCSFSSTETSNKKHFWVDDEGDENMYKGDGSFPKKSSYSFSASGYSGTAKFTNQKVDQSVSSTNGANGNSSTKWCTVDLVIEVNNYNGFSLTLAGTWRDYSGGINKNESYSKTFTVAAHTCNSSRTSTDDTYFKTAATCVKKAIYYKSCSVCGKASTQTFESGSLGSHSIDGGLCSLCNHGFFFYTTSDNKVFTDNNYEKFQDSNNAVLNYTNTTIDGKLCLETTAPIYTITMMAFYNITTITSIQIPKTVDYIAGGAFMDCTGLTGDLTIPDNVTFIGEKAFQNCSNFNGTLTLGEKVNEIYNYAFCSTGFTNNVVIPNSVTSIGKGIFQKSTISGVTIGDGVEAIPEYAFASCWNLSSAPIPSSVKSIGAAAFASSGLTSITIPSSVETLGEKVCHSATKLTSVKVGNSIKNIPSQSFYGCSELKNVTLGNSVEQISNDAFGYCTNLANIYYHSLAKSDFSSTFSHVPSSCKHIFKLNDNSYVTNEKGKYFKNPTTPPTYTRETEHSSNWGTLILPFEAKSDDDVQLYKLTNVSGSTLSFSPVKTVASNTPCVFKKKGYAIYVRFTANSNNVDNGVPTTTDAVNGLTMKGTYTKKENQTGIYFIANNQFWYAEDAITINPFRAWFEGTLPSGAKEFTIVVDDEATGVLQMENGELKMQNTGKYMENGRIVIVKNGKKYNANGQVIK